MRVNFFLKRSGFLIGAFVSWILRLPKKVICLQKIFYKKFHDINENFLNKLANIYNNN